MFGRKKQAKENFRAEKLPHNRVQVFFDVYRNRFSVMMRLGLIALAFFLPATAVMTFTNLKVYEVQALVAAGSVTAEEGAATVFGLINAGNLLMIAALAAAAAGIAGICGVVRRLIWQEGVLFAHDFGRSVKENAPTFCLIAAAGGVLNYLLQYALRNLYFSQTAGAEIAAIAAIAATALFLPTIPLILTQCTLYNLPLHKKICNAFLLTMRTAYLSFPAAAANAAPFLLLLIPSAYVFVPLLVILPLFAVPSLITFDMLFCDYVLDKFVNKSNFPEIYDKGIWRNAVDKNR